MGSRSTQIRMAEQKRSRWAYGAVGFLLVVALTVIAYLSAPAVLQFLRRSVRGFSTAGLPDSQVELMFTGVVFLVLLAIVGVVVFAAAPKEKDTTSMSDMVKEREQMVRAKQNMKKRQRRINRQMREDLKGRQK